MGNDLIGKTALLGYIKDGLDNFPPFVDDADKVEWIIRCIENAPVERESNAMRQQA